MRSICYSKLFLYNAKSQVKLQIFNYIKSNEAISTNWKIHIHVIFMSKQLQRHTKHIYVYIHMYQKGEFISYGLNGYSNAGQKGKLDTFIGIEKHFLI